MENNKKNNQSPAGGQSASAVDKFFLPLLAVIAIVLFLVGYFFFLKNQYLAYANGEKTKLKQIENTIKDLEKQKQELAQNTSAGLDFSASEENLLALALPDKYDYGSIVIQLTKLSERYGFAITDLQVNQINRASGEGADAAAAAGPVKQVSISLKATGGDYNQWRQFLKALESSVMIFDLKSVSFSDKGDYQLEALAYYYQSNK